MHHRRQRPLPQTQTFAQFGPVPGIQLRRLCFDLGGKHDHQVTLGHHLRHPIDHISLDCALVDIHHPDRRLQGERSEISERDQFLVRPRNGSER